jgi:putative membrane protein
VPSQESQDTAARLSKLVGAAFDKAYVAEMVSDHEKDIKEFEAHQDDPDADVAGWVQKTLPALREHLRLAQEAQKIVGGL